MGGISIRRPRIVHPRRRRMRHAETNRPRDSLLCGFGGWLSQGAGRLRARRRRDSRPNAGAHPGCGEASRWLDVVAPADPGSGAREGSGVRPFRPVGDTAAGGFTRRSVAEGCARARSMLERAGPGEYRLVERLGAPVESIAFTSPKKTGHPALSY